jgi:peptidoglycan/xylan/chitin deacetylase (PgdA/CDA1 family)
VVILYHRVNDVSVDPLTTSLERFAAHMCVISQWYLPIATSDLVRRVRNRAVVPPGSVAVHFDDCYRDVYTNAFPILQACRIFGAAFVNSGFVGTSRVLAHDLESSPFRFENFVPEDLRAMVAAGFEIGAHTVNHVDLGSCATEVARIEIADSVKDLERMTSGTITLFSYPFGKETNIRPELRQTVAEAGCECMFSAFGGMVDSATDAYDIPRIGVSSGHTPLYLALQIEGIAPDILRKKLLGRR